MDGHDNLFVREGNGGLSQSLRVELRWSGQGVLPDAAIVQGGSPFFWTTMLGAT